jgi:hypothetical protein
VFVKPKRGLSIYDQASVNYPPKEGVYKYVRLCEQIFYDDFEASHRYVATKEDILKQISHYLLSNPQDVGAGVFIIFREELGVVTNGSTTLTIPCDGPGSDDDLKIFTEKSTPYGFKVIKLSSRTS